MTIGKFNILDVARIKISANGKTQTVDIIGPKNLKGNENEKKQEKSRESERKLRMFSGPSRFSKEVGVE